MKETGSTFALLVCAVSIASGCRLGDAARSADSHAGTWVMREFMISHWGFPKDEERLQQFLADSFNTVIAVPDELPYCREHGLKALLAEAGDRAAEFVDDPVVWGFFVLDEPTRKNIPYDAVAPKVAAFHEVDATRPAYVNLNELDDPERFIRTVKPRVLSYDYYQWWVKTEPFFPLLEKFRRAALDADLPLLFWSEAVVVPGGPIPSDNESKIRKSVYCALAYGVKGIQWWAWRDFNRDAGKINAELKRLGPILVQLHSTDVFHTPPLPPATRPIPASFRMQSPSRHVVLGLFENDRHDEFILVANRDHEHERTVELRFSGSVIEVRALDRKTGEWDGLNVVTEGDGRVVRFFLVPGDGVLLRILRSGGFPRR